MSKVLSYFIYSVIWLFSLLPLRVLFLFSDILYLLNRYVIKYREKVVLTNLRNSFPEKDEPEIQKIKNEFFRHLTDFLIESVKIVSISKKELDKRFIYENLNLINEFQGQGRNITLISGHYGNWEWLINLPEKLQNDFLVIYQPLKSKFSDKFINNLRGRFGGKLIPMKDFYKQLVYNYNNNRPTSAWFLGDQRPAGAKKIHYWKKFLNQDTAFYLGPEKVARKYNHVVVFMDIQKQKRGYYRTSFELLVKEGKESKGHEIIDSFIHKLESVIRERPAYWLWSHKRWKD